MEDRIARSLSDEYLHDAGIQLVHIEVKPIPDESEIYVAICDWQRQWWGNFACFEFSEGRIQWMASISRMPNEQSIARARGLRLAHWCNPLIEVFGCTHMGNGSFYLYELRNQSLELVLETRAVDCHSGDNRVIRNTFLTPKYVDLNGDSWPDVRLSGFVDHLDVETNSTMSSAAYCAEFIWQQEAHRFVPSLGNPKDW
jgi:hypothetical protein